MAFMVAHMEINERVNRRPRDYKPRKTLADICERELGNYRFPRGKLTELIALYEASPFPNATARAHAIPAETEVRALLSLCACRVSTFSTTSLRRVKMLIVRSHTSIFRRVDVMIDRSRQCESERVMDKKSIKQ